MVITDADVAEALMADGVEVSIYGRPEVAIHVWDVEDGQAWSAYVVASGDRAER